MASSFPQGLLESEFPGMGKGLNPVFETDGDSLFIRRVKIEGKFYDIRIWRVDDKGKLIFSNKDSKFDKQTIIDVQNLAIQLFTKANFGESPVGSRLWYSDVERDKPICVCENAYLPEGDVNKTKIFSGRQKDHPIVGYMKQIHHRLSHNMGTAVTADPSPVISPREVSPEKYPPEKSSASEAPKKKRGKKDPVPKKVEELLPKGLQKDAATSTDTPATTASPTVPLATGTAASEERITPADHVDELREALEEASASYESESSYFTDISYADLEKYSQARGKKKDTKLEDVYQTYLRVLKTPEAADNEHTKEMKKWLKHHYEAALAQYQQKHLKLIWSGSKEGKSYDEWCRYYAAKWIPGLILAEGQSIDKLVAWLKETDVTPAAAIAKPKGSIWWPPNWLA